MRKVAEDKAVFDGAGLALIGVADDVADGIGLFADQVPLHRSGKARAAHAFQFRFFERGQQTIPILAGDEAAEHAIFFVIALGIRSASTTLFPPVLTICLIPAP